MTNNIIKDKKKMLFWTTMVVCISLVVAGLLFSTVALYHSYTKGTNATKVAVYAADVEKQDIDKIIIDCDSDVLTTNYDFTVKNTYKGVTSEVSQKYDVIVEFDEPLDSFIKVGINNSNVNTSNSGKTYEFSNDNWKFKGGTASEKDLSLVFTVTDATKVKQDIEIPNIRIRVDTTQID